MKIINVCEATNGILTSIESFIIEDTLGRFQNNKYFFTEKEAVEKAENLFKTKLLEHGAVLEDDIEDILDSGYIEFYSKNHETIELYIFWSGINVNE